VNETLGPRLAYNHAQHQSCTTCLPTLLSFQDYISLKLLYEQSLTRIVVSFQQLDSIVANQIQATQKNIACIVQYFHYTGAIWETITHHSRKHITLLWLTSRTPLFMIVM